MVLEAERSCRMLRGEHTACSIIFIHQSGKGSQHDKSYFIIWLVCFWNNSRKAIHTGGSQDT